MQVLTRGEVLRRIVERTQLEDFAGRVLDSFWDQPAFQQVHPPRDDVRAWVRWNLDLVIRWLVDGLPPTENEEEIFREHARARVADGTPADVVPANFRRGARFAWRALLDAATEAERPALLDSADLLFEYVDRVSRLYAEVYEAAARAAPESAEERGARALLRRLSNDEAGLPEDIQLAERISFELERAPRPFVIAAPLRQARHHAELAAQLRRRGALAASEGRRVVGLANTRSPWSGIELDPSAIVAQAPAAIRSECGQALDELRGAVDVASARGRRGEIAAEDYLAELLLRRSPRVASRISSRIYAPLSEELARTLDVLVLNSFERGASAAELPVHRNTLRDRIKRISELTGIDLDSARGRGLAWLACLERRDSVSPESAGVES